MELRKMRGAPRYIFSDGSFRINQSDVDSLADYSVRRNSNHLDRLADPQLRRNKKQVERLAGWQKGLIP